jgi:hypothetical protein
LSGRIGGESREGEEEEGKGGRGEGRVHVRGPTTMGDHPSLHVPIPFQSIAQRLTGSARRGRRRWRPSGWTFRCRWGR